MELYFELFKNSFISSLLPGKTEWFFWVMKEFSAYNSFLVIIIPTIAGTLASIVNYFIAYAVRLISTKHKIDSEYWYKSEQTFNRVGKYLLSLSCFSLIGIILSFISGRLKLNFKTFTITVFFSRFFYYCFFTL